MRAVIQRVKNASVAIKNNTVAQINNGLFVLLGVETQDNAEDAIWLANKIVQLRIFSDENNLMNKSVIDIDGEILIVSQFTLHAKTKKGNRPSFVKSANSEVAIPLYSMIIDELSKKINKKVQSGQFGENMQVSLCNNGPVTILIDSKNKE